MARLAEIRDRIRNAPSLSLFLDFDGTLTPIVDNPAEARLDGHMRRVLTVLSNLPDVLMVVISGRALSDLRARIGIDRVVYAGNHGLEIVGEGVRFIEPFAAAKRELLSRISQILANSLRDILGVEVEYKGLTASVHYRRASPAHYRDIEIIVRNAVTASVSPFCVSAGQMVWEILPKSDWHKGAAVCWINSRLAGKGAVSIYLGDDQTDETAFRKLTDEITVRVGDAKFSSARYRVADPEGVREFLSWLSRNR